MFKPLLIHNNNTPIKNICDSSLVFNIDSFDFGNGDVDTYISKNILPLIKDKDFNILFIKDNLSANYLELYGILLAYHIRLSNELGEKIQKVPIVILSDIDGYILNKINPMANILFTKNTFVSKNNQASFHYFEKAFDKIIELQDFNKDFLNLIEVKPPQDYLSHHSITNEWSMYRWAEYLDVNTPDIEKIRDDISSMLYFKYLQAKFPIKQSLFGKHKQEIRGKGKILYIDDEWEKGWKSIFEYLSQENEGYSLETVQEVYKDKSQEEVIAFVMEKVVSVNPDVIILDMRLHEDDFLENVGLADFTGIQIFNEIKEINPGIQVIIFTASSNSLLLDQLNSYDSSILGYVKKEHPKNYNLTTQGNINKLISLINKGLERKYLKQIWTTSQSLIKKLENDPFRQYFIGLEFENLPYCKSLSILHSEVKYIFKILNGNMDNKLNYALISLASSLDALQNIFIECSFDRTTKKKECDYLGRKLPAWVDSLNTYILYIIEKMNHKNTFNNSKNKSLLKKLIKARNSYIHADIKRMNPELIEVCKDYNQDGEEKQITSKDILEWFELLNDIVGKIEQPKKRKVYKQESMNTLGDLDGLKDIKKKK